MRNWKAAERALRRETALNVGALRGEQVLPLVIAVGGAKPRAVLALGGVDPEDPMETVAELATLASALTPSRALVGVAIPRGKRRLCGVLVCCDMRAVADGLVEVTRLWVWWRLGRWVWWGWPRIEARTWKSGSDLLSGVAATILSRRSRRAPELVERLVQFTVASGHRVRLVR